MQIIVLILKVYSNALLICSGQYSIVNTLLGYVTRQALYSCLTCTVDGEMAGICLACSLTCHKGGGYF